jgi:hypothetical protein
MENSLGLISVLLLHYIALSPKWKGVQEKLNVSILRMVALCGRIGVSLK